MDDLHFDKLSVCPRLAIILFLAFFWGLHMQAQQKFEIVSFEPNELDLSAKNYPMNDNDGSLMALVRVKSEYPDDKLHAYSFKFGYLRSEVVDKRNELGEMWVYVQRNAKHVTITRDGFLPVTNYDLGFTIEAGMTYELILSPRIGPVQKQMVQFNISPANVQATVMVRQRSNDASEELFGIVDANGFVEKALPLGTYEYRVLSDGGMYKESKGQFRLADRNQTHVEKVALQPNFGQVTLTVDADADIYVDGELRGRRSWTGVLKAGSYSVECRQENHHGTSEYITIAENDNRTFQLTRPTPVTGTLALISKPTAANISIDGKDYGQTPKNIDIIIGRHSLTLTKSNYNKETQTFEIKENEITELTVALNDIARMTIKSRPTGSMLSIDGKEVGATPYTADLASGDYQVRLVHDKYHDLVKKIHLDSSHPEVTLSLSRQYQLPTGGYVQGTFQAGTLMGIGACAGGYLSNFNAELFYTLGMGKETFYLNATDGSPSTEANLKPTLMGVKVGYGIIVGTRLRVTPQVGFGALTVKGDGVTTGASCASVGMRADYVLAPNVGVNLTPEAQFAMSKNDLFTQLADMSSGVKGWGTGAALRIGLYLYF